MKKGIFITFEGAEGSGKSTQIKRAAQFFRRKGRQVLLLREPGGTKISEAIRGILLDKKNKEMSSETELFLYLAARAQIVREKILPALQKGKVVICDRFEDSTVAYQGYGRGISLKIIEAMSWLVRGNLKQDLTFVLDIDVRRGLKRGGRHDRIERESLEFHCRVRKGFLSAAKKEPRRMVILGTGQPVHLVSKRIEEKLKHDFDQ